MKTTPRIAVLALLVALGCGLTLSACENNDGPLERAGERVDEAVDDVKDDVKDTVN